MLTTTAFFVLFLCYFCVTYTRYFDCQINHHLGHVECTRLLVSLALASKRAVNAPYMYVQGNISFSFLFEYCTGIYYVYISSAIFN